MALEPMTALLAVLEASSHQQHSRTFVLCRRSLITSIITKGSLQCLASLVHLQCTPVSWHNASSVGRLYLILFIWTKYLPVKNKENFETNEFDENMML
jgi:hypothetical protein